MHPLRPKVNRKQAIIFILAIWLLTMVISFPIVIVSQLKQTNLRYEYCDVYVCKEDWPPQQRYYYSIALMILQYLVPLLVLLFTYSSIAILVWGKGPPREAENVRDQRMARSKVKNDLDVIRVFVSADNNKVRIVMSTEKKKRMIKMMMMVVIVFTICWLPFNILILIMDNDEHIRTWAALLYIWAALHWLSMSHACYNPVIYCWMNAGFRQGFYLTLKKVPLLNRLVPEDSHACNSSVGGGIAMTGISKAADSDAEVSLEDLTMDAIANLLSTLNAFLFNIFGS